MLSPSQASRITGRPLSNGCSSSTPYTSPLADSNPPPGLPWPTNTSKFGSGGRLVAAFSWSSPSSLPRK